MSPHFFADNISCVGVSQYIPSSGRSSAGRLVDRVSFQEDGLFQGAEELLIGHRIFHGAEIELCAGADEELRLIAVTDGDGQSHEVAAVVEGTPRSVISREKQEGVWTVQDIGGIEEAWSFKIDVFLSGHDSQFLIEHVDLAVQVLQGRDDRLEHLVPIWSVEHACLRGPNLDLTFFRQPDLCPGVRLIVVSHFVGRTGREQRSSSNHCRQQPSQWYSRTQRSIGDHGEGVDS